MELPAEAVAEADNVVEVLEQVIVPVAAQLTVGVVVLVVSVVEPEAVQPFPLCTTVTV
jgi:hypothetical protein